MTDHLKEEELIARLDEPERGDSPAVARHLETCLDCRDRLAELERLFAALRAPLPRPSEEAFVAQRERVLEAVHARPRGAAAEVAPRGAAVRTLRAWHWVPLAAAAAIAGLILLSPDDRMRAPAEAPQRPVAAAGSSLPVVAEARRAADEAFDAVESEAAEPAAAELEAAVAAMETNMPIIVSDDAELSDQFAALAPEDQDAILNELSAMTFDL